jgi:hypothetical protein
MHKKASKKLNVLKSMKYRLDRSTLISLYTSLIRPVMEYADVIWDGCSEYESNILEGIQYEATRVVTGAIKGTSKGRLLNQLCWEDLKTRRYLHKMFFLYTIINLLTPSYLRDILPLQVSERSEYSLRSSENIISIPSKTEHLKKSFYPSSITDWNELDRNLRNVESISLFKSKLRDIFCVTKYNTLYNTSLSRYSSILHTRLRLGHCALNLYLYRIGCKPSPFCECHWGIYETLSHYFLHCPLYAAQRQILFSISARLLPTIWSSLSESQKVNLFLHGSDKLGYADNQTLLHNVQLFILNSKRFTNCVHDS